MIQEFEKHFKDWVRSACKEWERPERSDEYFAKVDKRVPKGLQSLLVLGIKKELIILQGHYFTLKGLSGEKRYQWFHNNEELGPCWEYFMHVGEFVRLYSVALAKGLKLTFEDDYMDLALYLNDKLVVCYEVKEQADELQKLIEGIKGYQQSINFNEDDRGNDPLRKAKYIVKRRPEYFCGIAIGVRFEYRVDYPKDHAFQLVEDVIPWI